MLTPGDPAPWFLARSTVNAVFSFDTVGGRYIVLCFFCSAADPASRRILDDSERSRDRFDVDNLCFFGVSIDPNDEGLQRVKQQWPGIIFFWDFDRGVSRLYGAASADGSSDLYLPHTILLDPALRTLAVLPFDANPETYVSRLLRIVDALPPVRTLFGPAPVLVVPGVFEPDFCRLLIGLYEQHGGQDSGFMRDVDGKTVGVLDYSHKRRTDYEITDPGVIRAVQARIVRRLVPEIRKAFQFNASRIERHLVGCYDSSKGGHFRAHRDNTTHGTAYRRFAVSFKLNAEEYEGGDLCFPDIRPKRLPGAYRRGGRLFLFAPPRGDRRDQRTPLRVPALPL
jgi:peroxiredoxin